MLNILFNVKDKEYFIRFAKLMISTMHMLRAMIHVYYAHSTQCCTLYSRFLSRFWRQKYLREVALTKSGLISGIQNSIWCFKVLSFRASEA